MKTEYQVESFKANLINKLEYVKNEIEDDMPHKGNSSEESQKVYVLNLLSKTMGAVECINLKDFEVK